MKQKKGIAILGSTGSIGTQALDVIEAHPDHFDLQVLTANNSADLLIEQAIKYKPNTAVIVNDAHFEKVKTALWEHDIHVYAGEDSLSQVVESSEIDTVLTAMVGYAGLRPTLAAVRAKKNIALANKETLVVAGEILTKEARENGVNIYPVDSEHSAIFQCLAGEFHNKIEKIYLTASGGPFRGYTKEQLMEVTKAQALKHPNWEMGAKITVDSATLMNKGLEVIEAKWLFNLAPEQIDVIVHPQSIIHSIVQFEDGSMKAQMGLPDMKLPIQYALTYPDRISSNFPRFNFLDYPQLTFEKPDQKTFTNLQLAFDVLEIGGTAACTLNAANEIAVDAFLNQKITFLDIPRINAKTLKLVEVIQKPTVEDYIKIDKLSREVAAKLI
ncbi:MAG: 1-deoxy-D-xylulose-5-phosphate reductoisomerase [Crocinitomicaceae bacterium]|nr:1-deoxy-D-xylulose-5-phosphate reductoisomerase [Crocinitomicaceae bacterium]